MCCVACCWKSCLMPAVLYWKTPAASVTLSRLSPCRRAARRAAGRRPPRVRVRMLAHFMVHLYIAVVCSYGEALADRIVSYRIAIFCLISYRIYHFLLWLYRAITKNNLEDCTTCAACVAAMVLQSWKRLSTRSFYIWHASIATQNNAIS